MVAELNANWIVRLMVRHRGAMKSVWVHLPANPLMRHRGRENARVVQEG